MSVHKTPLTELEHDGLLAHRLPIGVPSQLSDAFRLGIKWANEHRIAELQAKAVPELSVFYGPMPESNGKSNFTAILYRGDDISGGFTFARSEYPDRVRYEADCMRHIIGQLAEEPDILAYDAEKRSGYAAPAASPVVPESCEWHEDTDGVWQSDCGVYYSINDDTPEKNGMKFCLGCGKPLRTILPASDLSGSD